MSFQIRLSPIADLDLDAAVIYYNTQQTGLGIRFASETNDALMKIGEMPFAYSTRYENVRAAKIRSFPYLIFYTIDERIKVINVLRIFNTYQKPYF